MFLHNVLIKLGLGEIFLQTYREPQQAAPRSYQEGLAPTRASQEPRHGPLPLRMHHATAPPRGRTTGCPKAHSAEPAPRAIQQEPHGARPPRFRHATASPRGCTTGCPKAHSAEPAPRASQEARHGAVPLRMHHATASPRGCSTGCPQAHTTPHRRARSQGESGGTTRNTMQYTKPTGREAVRQ